MKKTELPEFMQFFVNEVFPIWKAERDGTLAEYQRKSLLKLRRAQYEPSPSPDSPLSDISQEIGEKIIDILKDYHPEDALPALENICRYVKKYPYKKDE